jgi:hypothetical protein
LKISIKIGSFVLGMGLLNESLQQVCLSIERLEPCEEGLHKLLSLIMAAHHLLSDEEIVIDEGMNWYLSTLSKES